MWFLMLFLLAKDAAAAPCRAPGAAIERTEWLRLAGQLDEALALAERTLDCADLSRDDAVGAWLEVARIQDRFGLHRNTRPMAAALEAIEAAATVEELDTASRARIETAFASYHYRAGMAERDFSRARRHGEAAVRLFDILRDAHGQADAVHQLGLIELQEGELERARELFDQSLGLDRAGGARVWFCGEYERHVAFVEDRQGNLAAAIPRYRKSLECRVEASAIDASLFAAVSLGSALVRAGKPAAAAEPLAYAARIARQIDSPVGGMYANLALGRMHEATGDAEAARAAYTRALETAEAVNSRSADSARTALERLKTKTVPD